MRDILALTILGFDNQEGALVGFCLDLSDNNNYGEISGYNIRQILNLTKDQLFEILERLVQRNIAKYLTVLPTNSIYIKGGEGFYIFNKVFSEWVPSNNSLFYKLCKIYNLKFNNMSYNYIINNFDIRNTILKEQLQEKNKFITPYEIYDDFCKYFKKIFNKEYKPLNQSRDFQTIKNIICKFNYDNIKDNYIKDFIKWCFEVKVKDFKGEFIIGFLPMCLKDYLIMNQVERIKSNLEKDEDGRLRLKDSNGT